MTIHETIALVATRPGRTATELANLTRSNVKTLSSQLYILAEKQHRLLRYDEPDVRNASPAQRMIKRFEHRRVRTAWRYYPVA